ncbi:hypothetical protein KCTCHS21_37080 [Cohnella abietis]|uniref:Oligopeptide/dipeptide ABC transporter C-terminal domain-containing protein n=2 Tax=Cohnella abietis TaxID=2507935 RepID=A0A3T1D8B5_9BACL|nr:hypothetical protein KCTCHS21_37080 [Cohnella abietis]
MLKELQNEGRTILMITHDMTLVAEYADHAAVLSGGELLATGTVNQLFTDHELMHKAGLKPPPVAILSHLLIDESSLRNDFPIFTAEGWVRHWLKASAAFREGVHY